MRERISVTAGLRRRRLAGRVAALACGGNGRSRRGRGTPVRTRAGRERRLETRTADPLHCTGKCTLRHPGCRDPAGVARSRRSRAEWGEVVEIPVGEDVRPHLRLRRKFATGEKFHEQATVRIREPGYYYVVATILQHSDDPRINGGGYVIGTGPVANSGCGSTNAAGTSQSGLTRCCSRRECAGFVGRAAPKKGRPASATGTWSSPARSCRTVDSPFPLHRVPTRMARFTRPIRHPRRRTPVQQSLSPTATLAQAEPCGRWRMRGWRGRSSAR